MQENIKKAIDYVLLSEGGWNASEVTMRGVEQSTYDHYRDTRRLPRQSVRKISDAEVYDIYTFGYAVPVYFNLLPAGLDYAMLDLSINSGPHEAIVLLQRSLQLTEDGRFGYETLGAVRGCDVATIIDRLCDTRLSFLRRLRNWGKNAKGWTARVALVRKRALAMAGAVPADEIGTRNMNSDQIMSAVRWILTTAGTTLGVKYLQDGNNVAMAGSFLAPLVAFIWSQVTHSDNGKA